MRSWTVCRLIAICFTALGALVFGVASASAGVGYKDACASLGEPAFCKAGETPEPIGVAVDDSASSTKGDVYVVDVGHNRIDRFGAAGEALSPIGEGKFTLALWDAVDDSTDSTAGDLYVADFLGNKIDLLSPTGTLVTSFSTGEQPAGVGVDPATGNIFVAERGPSQVSEYTPAGHLEKSFPVSGGGPLDGLAVDASGNVYQVFQNGEVAEYPAANRATPEVIDNKHPVGVAVNPSTGEIFVADDEGSGEITVYENASPHHQLASFGKGNFGATGSYGLGVNVTTHDVYAGNREEGTPNGGGVVFEPGETPEAPENISPPTEITGTTAMLHGKLNPGGAAGELNYHFDYNASETSCAGGAATTTETAAEAKEKEVTNEAIDLSPKTKYAFCLVAENPFGPTLGSPPVIFETGAGAPEIEAQAFVQATPTTAEVSATINPEGAATTCEVEYGTASVSGFENKEPCPALAEPEAITGQPVKVELKGPLTPGTMYKFRFSATNSVETVKHTEEVFETKPLVEGKVLSAKAASESATLNAEFKAGPEGGSYQFEYNAKEGPVLKTTLVTIEHETKEGKFETISAPVANLVPGETYYVKFVVFAKGSNTPIPGGETEFKTEAAKPTVVNIPVPHERIGRHEVTLTGEVKTGNAQTTYYVEYGETIAYEAGATSPLGELPKAIGLSKISPVTLSELKAGTLYHYRIVAENEAGKTVGSDETFMTAAPTPPIVVSESVPQFAQTTATLAAEVNPDGLQTSYALEVGTEVEENGVRRIAYTPTYGEVGSGTENVTLVLPLTGLLPGITYHYRIVPTNEDGTVPGPDQTFTTTGFPAVITPPALVTLVPFTPPPVVNPGPTRHETRGEMYTKAVKHCETIKSKKKRAACMKTAKKKYGPVTKRKKKK